MLIHINTVNKKCFIRHVQCTTVCVGDFVINFFLKWQRKLLTRLGLEPKTLGSTEGSTEGTSIVVAMMKTTEYSCVKFDKL